MVCRPSCAGECVRRPMSSLMYPTPLTGPNEPPYLTNSAISYMSVVTDRYIRTLHCRISRGPQHTRRSQRLPREHGTERTKLLFGEGLEWAKVHNSANVVGIEVRLWSNGVEVCGGRSSRVLMNDFILCFRLTAAGHILLPRVSLLPG